VEGVGAVERQLAQAMEHCASDEKRKAMRKQRDGFFIMNMLVAGNARTAWVMVNDTKLDFWELHVELRTRLFDDAEDLNLWSDAFQVKVSLKESLLEKCVHDLEVMEKKVGVSWVSDGQEGG
jgi:hypothetical protein